MPEGLGVGVQVRAWRSAPTCLPKAILCSLSWLDSVEGLRGVVAATGGPPHPGELHLGDLHRPQENSGLPAGPPLPTGPDNLAKCWWGRVAEQAASGLQSDICLFK